MDTKPRLRRVLSALLLAVSAIGVTSASADAYRFEMVIFERPNAAIGEAPPDAAEPTVDNAAVGRLARFAVGGRKLGGVAFTLKKKGMIVHEHLAWVQEPRGRNSKAWYSVGDGRLSGVVRVTRGRFLHVDADLLLRDVATAQPLRARLYRRMRSDELHYLDHPRLGIVIRADRVEEPTKPDAADAAAGEPKPAEPPRSVPPVQQPG
ncbi:MAG: CsiV family protein [Gammaproteobacteria bacterium]|nr:CsiV family protein [Gammaproteobacteria bacterium]